MVTQIGVFWLGTMALAISYLGIARATDRQSQIITLAFGIVFWGAFAISTTNYAIHRDATVYSTGSQALTLIGILGVGMSVVLLFEAVMRGVTD